MIIYIVTADITVIMHDLLRLVAHFIRRNQLVGLTVFLNSNSNGFQIFKFQKQFVGYDLLLNFMNFFWDRTDANLKI
jgi:hypothetical protein